MFPIISHGGNYLTMSPLKSSGWRIWMVFCPSAFLHQSVGPQDLNIHPCECKPKTWCNAPLSLEVQLHLNCSLYCCFIFSNIKWSSHKSTNEYAEEKWSEIIWSTYPSLTFQSSLQSPSWTFFSCNELKIHTFCRNLCKKSN